jgi:ATP-dependent DNA helicase DinG
VEIIEELAAKARKALSPDGALSAALKGFHAREAQLQLTEAIARAVDEQSLLVAEAGTGTGKTFAYLIPGLLSGKRVIISTATKTLQDQLFQKDLPLLIKALGLSVSVQNLKGRSNYICRHRVNLHASEGRLPAMRQISDIHLLKEKMPQLVEGERGEVPEIKEDSDAWPYLTSTRENCLGSECPEHARCYLMKARKRALEADVVVINHHLFFADSRLKNEGFGELLPGTNLIVFDEAHQLADIAGDFYADRLGTRQFLDLIDDTIKEWPADDLQYQPLKNIRLQSELLFDKMLTALEGEAERFPWLRLKNHARFKDLWQEWAELKDQLASSLNEDQVDDNAGIKSCRERFLQIDKIMTMFSQEEKDTKKIRWVERHKYTLVFHASPYEIKTEFSQLIKQLQAATVFTSATLTMAGRFDCFTEPLGLSDAETLLLPSPFDYMNQALLYLPRSLPDPKDRLYNYALLKQVAPIIRAFGGRCFFLFTSHRALREVAELIHQYIDFPVLVQGEESKSILLARFRQYGNAVLLGTASFWEGVDVKGDALSCVIIDKLPFASPVDPVIRAKMDYLKSKGISSFDELTLPNAVIALKQGVGRLIRDEQDSGLLVIADPRLTSREYGRLILASLPKLPKTRDRAVVLRFIEELALENEECISD